MYFRMFCVFVWKTTVLNILKTFKQSTRTNIFVIFFFNKHVQCYLYFKIHLLTYLFHYRFFFSKMMDGTIHYCRQFSDFNIFSYSDHLIMMHMFFRKKLVRFFTSVAQSSLLSITVIDDDTFLN